MKKITLVLGTICVMFSSQILKSQESKPIKDYEIIPYGWVRTDYIFDSRQSARVREYNLNLYPLDEKLDANGNDINAAAASNYLAITSRVGIKFKGPDVWGAKISGNIEGDFFGNTEIGSATGTGSIGLFRLRHAFANLSWEKTSLILGQTWYPMVIPEVYPGVANFNSSMLFNPFGFATQIKIHQQLNNEFSADFVVYKDREFTTGTAVDAVSNSATFNSVLPTFHAKVQFKNENIVASLAAE